MLNQVSSDFSARIKPQKCSTQFQLLSHLFRLGPGSSQIQEFNVQNTYWLNYWHILISKVMSGFRSNTDVRPRSAPTLGLISRAASSVGVMYSFQRSQHREQSQRRADTIKKGKCYEPLFNDYRFDLRSDVTFAQYSSFFHSFYPINCFKNSFVPMSWNELKTVLCI